MINGNRNIKNFFNDDAKIAMLVEIKKLKINARQYRNGESFMSDFSE